MQDFPSIRSIRTYILLRDAFRFHLPQIRAVIHYVQNESSYLPEIAVVSNVIICFVHSVV